MLPARFLRPQPGERVLDLCAAPGNKMAHLAVMLENQGTVVANDFNYMRMRGTGQTLERLGLINVTITICDGGNYPKRAGLFDKILVDAPCSCEGTSRKNIITPENANPDLSRQRSNGQKALLRKAVLRCKPGGRILYSTCTYAPEENEMVVDAILAEFGPEVLRLVPARMPNFTASAGLTAWEGRAFHPTLERTMRVWPHQNDSGGFFVAILEKQGSIDLTEARPEPYVPDAPPISPRHLEMLTAHFGFPSHLLSGLTLFQKNRDRVYLVAADHQPPQSPKPDASGMYFLNTSMRYPKLSTAAAMAFGPAATRNIIDLDETQAEAYLHRQHVQASAAQSQSVTGMGYVFVRYRGYVLGVGLFHPNESGAGGRIQNMFPRGWSPNQNDGVTRL